MRRRSSASPVHRDAPSTVTAGSRARRVRWRIVEGSRVVPAAFVTAATVAAISSIRPSISRSFRFRPRRATGEVAMRPRRRPHLTVRSSDPEEQPMATAVIVDAVRTAGGKRNGKLSGWHPADLAGEVLKSLVERNDLDPALIDDVVMGCVMQVGNQGLNIGRNAVLAAGFPESVPATTVDRQCGSSQQAAHFAAQGVIAGAYDVVIAAGVEVMSRVPMGISMAVGGMPFGPKVGLRYAGVGGLVPQGISAELIAEKWNI